MRRLPALVLVFVMLLLTAPASARTGDPEPGTPEWYAAEAVRVEQASERLLDQYAHPGYTSVFVPQMATEFVRLWQWRAEHLNPNRSRVTFEQGGPGWGVGDPYRSLDRWGGDRGQVLPIEFVNRNGALLLGHLWAPLPGRFEPPYPAIVITSGSLQANEGHYYWAAQGLAEAGYLVLSFDVQGQGESETFGHKPDGSTWCGDGEPEARPEEERDAPEEGPCPGVPWQQDANFVRGTVDALDLLFSTPRRPYRYHRAFMPESEGSVAFNPWWRLLDPTRVGLAGHSAGASAVSVVQQWDRRVDAIVAWDGLSSVRPRVPALGMTAESFVPLPFVEPPRPDANLGAFERWRWARVDAMEVALGGSSHFEFSYMPNIPASRLGERVAMHYTLAWFDRYVRGDRSATKRLTATVFDGSADRSSIGTGAWSPLTGNVPYRIKGIPVWERLSRHYRSAYWLERGGLRCHDVREGCR